MRQIKRAFQILRAWLILGGIAWKDDALQKDLARWKALAKLEEKDYVALAILLWERKEFRNLVIYRHRYKRLFRTWLALIYRPMNTLYIEAKEIGGGLYIQHGFSTMIAAESIGENCWINQQVTIGYKNDGTPPIIGNDVTITCGAKVIGSVVVGDGAVIGANAVVVHDVEPGAVMGGVPAKRIK